jgi:hypothetical protein
MSAAAAPQKSLVEMYEEWIATSIDDEGISLPHAFQMDAAGSLTLYALDVPPADGYHLMLSRWLCEKPRELIFGFDRFAKSGQGTTLGDLMAGFHIVGVTPRPFIIEYQHAPRIVKPIEWGNTFWNAALHGEFGASVRKLGIPA